MFRDDMSKHTENGEYKADGIAKSGAGHGSEKVKSPPRWPTVLSLTAGVAVLPLAHTVPSATASVERYAHPSVNAAAAQAGRWITAIIDDEASVDTEKPRCIGRALVGPLIMDTQERSGFPFDVRTFVKNLNHIASVVTTREEVGSESFQAVVIVKSFLNNRARLRAKDLVKNCASSFDVENTAASPILVSSETDTSTRFALYANICLWSHRPNGISREVRLAPGDPRSTRFSSAAACEAEKDDVFRAWLDEAKGSLGFTAGWAGNGYRIDAPHCQRITNPEVLRD
jgi:hypothetical protein